MYHRAHYDVTAIAKHDTPWRRLASYCRFHVNTLRPRRDEQHFADDIFKRIFFNENVWISFKISLKFVPKGPINNIPALVQIMAWRRAGAKPLSEPVMVSLPTHKCVTRLQWVKAQNKINIEAPCYWPFVMETRRSSKDYPISSQRASNAESVCMI